jgi:CRISPR-associated exonuclease Cas4
VNAGSASWDERIEVSISALEHFSYCPRQCALIHVEQTYEENLFTIRGTIAHERADSGRASTQGDVRTLRAVPLWSERYALTGKADAIELHASGPVPVEYKSGRRMQSHAAVQLCAQALCIEEMFETEVPLGGLYLASAHRRLTVRFDELLRARTSAMIDAVREMLERQEVPAAPNDERCPSCSLINACLPSAVAGAARIRGLQGTLFIPLEPPEKGESGDA